MTRLGAASAVSGLGFSEIFGASVSGVGVIVAGAGGVGAAQIGERKKFGNVGF